MPLNDKAATITDPALFRLFTLLDGSPLSVSDMKNKLADSQVRCAYRTKNHKNRSSCFRGVWYHATREFARFVWFFFRLLAICVINKIQMVMDQWVLLNLYKYKVKVFVSFLITVFFYKYLHICKNTNKTKLEFRINIRNSSFVLLLY